MSERTLIADKLEAVNRRSIELQKEEEIQANEHADYQELQKFRAMIKSQQSQPQLLQDDSNPFELNECTSSDDEEHYSITN